MLRTVKGWGMLQGTELNPAFVALEALATPWAVEAGGRGLQSQRAWGGEKGGWD